jgi:hypothetical protein
MGNKVTMPSFTIPCNSVLEIQKKTIKKENKTKAKKLEIKKCDCGTVGVAQVVECLPIKSEALISHPITIKKKSIFR